MANLNMATDITLEPIENVKKAEYNPREISDDALVRIKSSLKKFGWVIPSYKNGRTGTLMSGHQRSSIYQGEFVPTIVVDISEGAEARQNLFMNTITADVPTWYKGDDIILPDLSWTEKKFESNYNGKYTTELAIVNIDELNTEAQEVDVIASVAGGNNKMFTSQGFLIPIVIDTKGNIVTGWNRAIIAKEFGFDTAPCIIVDWEAEMCLEFYQAINAEYGKFDFDDLLAKARSSQRYVQPGRSYDEDKSGDCVGSTGASVNGFSSLWIFYARILTTAEVKGMTRQEMLQELADAMPSGKDTFLLDFGCGFCQEADRFIADGFKNVQKFEPFFQAKGGHINRQASKAMASQLMRKLKKGIRFEVAVLNTVLNSVMLDEDRQKLLLIISWLLREDGELVLSNRGRKDASLIAMTQIYKSRKKGNSKKLRSLGAFDDEKSIQINISNGSVTGTFFYTEEGMKADLLKYFHEVVVIHDDKIAQQKKTGSTSYIMKGVRPRYIKPKEFIEAMEWEFGIDYTETESLGMGEVAKEVAEKIVALREE